MYDLTGKTIDERYRFDGLIGEGTFARVYRIRDLRRSVDLAAKVLRQDIAMEPTFLARFRREAEVLEKLQHPHIVRYYGTVEAENLVFLLLEYIHGENLQSYMYKLDKPMTVRHGLAFVKPVTAALTYAHGEGIIHRDIKPANVLLSERGDVFLTDFGIARLLNEASTLTQDSTVGTPLYMAPEQLLGDPITVATDVYSLGVLMYQMFTGRPPFIGQTEGAEGTTASQRVSYEHLNVAPAPPREYNGEIPKAAADVIMKCLKKDPQARYSSAVAVYDAMAEAVGATPSNIEPVSVDTIKKPKPPESTLPEWSRVIPPVKQPPVEAEQKPRPVTTTPNNQKVDSERKPPVPTTPNNDRVESERKSSMPTTPSNQPVSSNEPQRPTLPSAPRVRDNAPQRQYRPPQASQPPPPSSRRSGGDRLFYGLVACGVIALLLTLALGIAILGFGLFSEEPDTPTPSANDSVVQDEETLQPTALAPTRTNAPAATTATATRDLSEVDAALPEPTSVSPITISDPSGIPEFVYAAESGGNLDIFKMNLETGDIEQLTSSRLNESGPEWSPDGERIAYYAYGSNDQADIYIMDADGENARNLTNTSRTNERVISWSPDGTKIAFHSNLDGDSDIYVYDFENDTVANYTNSRFNDRAPSWSPDGTRLLFHTNQVGGFNEIFMIDLTDPERDREQITNGNWRAAFPAWTPNGERLAFHAIIARDYGIYAINPDTSGYEELFDNDNNERHPDWSPSGNAMLYMRGSTSDPDIYYTNFDTSETTKVVDGGFYPDWRP